MIKIAKYVLVSAAVALTGCGDEWEDKFHPFFAADKAGEQIDCDALVSTLYEGETAAGTYVSKNVLDYQYEEGVKFKQCRLDLIKLQSKKCNYFAKQVAGDLDYNFNLDDVTWHYCKKPIAIAVSKINDVYYMPDEKRKTIAIETSNGGEIFRPTDIERVKFGEHTGTKDNIPNSLWYVDIHRKKGDLIKLKFSDLNLYKKAVADFSQF
jgi:hypothetical protein